MPTHEIPDDWLSQELPAEPDFDVPAEHQHQYSREDIQRGLARATYEFSYANRKLRSLELSKTIREKKVRIVLLAKEHGLKYITNPKLKAHLIEMYADPKFKWVESVLDAATYVEQEEILKEYNRYEKISKQAIKEFEMWQSQSIYLQSKWKHEHKELDS